jgi:hypothetical protein
MYQTFRGATLFVLVFRCRIVKHGSPETVTASRPEQWPVLWRRRGGSRTERCSSPLRDAFRARGPQLAGQSEQPQPADEPLRRIPLPPADCVAKVSGKSVVEVVVPLAEGEHGEHRVVPRRGRLGVGPRSPHVRQGVDEERGVVANRKPKESDEDQRAQNIAGDGADRDGDAEVEADGEQQVDAVGTSSEKTKEILFLSVFFTRIRATAHRRIRLCGGISA